MRIMSKKFLVLLFSFMFFTSVAIADQPEPVVCKDEVAPKVFSLGRSIGNAYYHLVDLFEKASVEPFVSLQAEYSSTLQSLNIIDIILEDLGVEGKSRKGLDKLRINFYNALKNQDLNEREVAFVRDRFVIFYENLLQEVKLNYCNRESWFLSLGFYTSFQLASLHSGEKEKILLSGFGKLLSARPVQVPDDIYNSLLTVYNLDKLLVTQSELAELENNLVKITEYFSNYPQTAVLISELEDLIGVWQGIVVNPENEKHDIRLAVNENLTAKMYIPGIADGVEIADIRVVNNYFTFMFKPFGTEKFYLRFSAKLSENIFSGEITDVLGSKGYWVLAKTDKQQELSEESLDKMVSYINELELRMKEVPVNAVKHKEAVVQEDEPELIEDIDYLLDAIVEEPEMPESCQQAPLAEELQQMPVEVELEQKTFWQKFISFFANLF